jgi:hypothetical protein
MSAFRMDCNVRSRPIADAQATGWHLMVMRLWAPPGLGGKRGIDH